MSTGSSIRISLKINGRDHKLPATACDTLLDVLRDKLGMTGTKKGCDMGACGACTVLAEGRRIKSCLALAASYDGRSITTIEGVGGADKFHQLQAAFIRHDALQCGYCTPGQIMSGLALLEEKPADSRSDPRGHERQPLPMRRLSEHRGGDRRGGWAMSGPSFQYGRAANAHDALIQASKPGTAFLAGGTDLLQLWKSGAMVPAAVVDISRLPLDDVEFVDGKLSLGALARLSDVATHPDVTRYHPLIAEAILASASGQIRNMATVGGNLLQRTRCPYFRNEAACLQQAKARQRMWRAFRREPPGCPVRCKRVMRRDARLGPGRCAGGTGRRGRGVRVGGTAALLAARSLQATRETPEHETNLAPVNSSPAFTCRTHPALPRCSTYLKIRDRASFEFAVVSVAAALQIENGKIVGARLAAGGVAPLPWRLDRTEAALVGRALDAQAIAAAGDMAVEHARRSPITNSRSHCCATLSSAPCKPSEAYHEHPPRPALRGRAEGYRQRRV